MSPSDTTAFVRRSPVSVLTIDAFAAAPFGGNPAAVCLLEPGQAAEESWMQSVAAEMNLSETAFVVRQADGAWGLRWFTPKAEVDLCGHATLASAHALWDTGRLAPEMAAVFVTRRSGRLECRRCDGEGGWIAMDFPSRPVTEAAVPPGLAEALGCDVRWAGRTAYDCFVEVAAAATVRGLAPDHARLAGLPVRGVIVTARGEEGSGFDFVSRFFAPGVGVAEDPVTGSAHCSLAPYWSERLGKTELRAWQASARGGEVRVRCLGERVELRGQAWTILRGELLR